MKSKASLEFFNKAPYCDILALIPRGAANAKHSGEIAPALGISRRSLCKHIENIRRNGIVIIGSTGGGYYFPETMEELERYIRQEEQRAKSMLYTLRTARTLRKNWSNDMTNKSLFDWKRGTNNEV